MATKAPCVILRVGQGGWTDNRFQEYRQSAKDNGMDWAGYWFYDDRHKPADQVALMKDIIGDDAPASLWLDLERDYGGDFDGPEDWLRCLGLMKDAFPDTVIGIYTAYYYWVENVHESEFYWFSDYILWVAHYTDQEQPFSPPPWGQDWVIWQYTYKGDGAAWGVESAGIDLNYMDEKYYSFVFGDGENPPPQNGDVMKIGTVTAGALNVRSAPVVGDNLVGAYIAGRA